MKMALWFREEAAAKLTSEHLYVEEFEVTEDHKLDKVEFAKYAPIEAKPQRMQKLNERGIVRRGTVLEPNDIIIAVLQSGRHRGRTLSQSSRQTLEARLEERSLNVG